MGWLRRPVAGGNPAARERRFEWPWRGSPCCRGGRNIWREGARPLRPAMPPICDCDIVLAGMALISGPSSCIGQQRAKK